MCGGNPSAFCASRSVAHSDALFKVLKNSFFIQAFFIKKRSEKEILCSHLPFLVCRLQLDTAYNLRRIRKKCTRQPEFKFGKSNIFPPLRNIGILQKIAKLRKKFFGIPPFKGGGVLRKAFYFARNNFYSAAYFFWGRQREKSETASFNFYFKLVVRIPVPRQMLGLCGGRKKRRICAH